MAAPIDISSRTTMGVSTGPPREDPAASMSAPVIDPKDPMATVLSLARGMEAIASRVDAAPAPAGTPPRPPVSWASVAAAAFAVVLAGAWIRAESAHEIASETRLEQARRDGEAAAERVIEAKRIADTDAKLAELKQAQIDALDLFTDSSRASLQLQLALWRKVAGGEEPPVDTSKESREERERRLRLRLEPK